MFYDCPYKVLVAKVPIVVFPAIVFLFLLCQGRVDHTADLIVPEMTDGSGSRGASHATCSASLAKRRIDLGLEDSRGRLFQFRGIERTDFHAT